MPKVATVPLSDELAARSLEHGTMYSFVISEADAEELAAGRVPEMVRSMAQWACEPVEVMLTRKRRTK